MGEYMSDNVDEYKNHFSSTMLDEMYRWKDATQVNNDTPDKFWATYYASIANANQALKAIDELGGPTTELLKQCKGEALICRAYAHFMLVNIFCMNYGMPNSNTDPGVYYMYGYRLAYRASEPPRNCGRGVSENSQRPGRGIATGERQPS